MPRSIGARRLERLEGRTKSLPLRLTLAGFTSLPGILTGRHRLRALPGLPVAYLSYAGHLCPLRPDAPAAIGDLHGFDHSWGGPTLVGAWAVPALVALGPQLPSFWLLSRPARNRTRVEPRSV